MNMLFERLPEFPPSLPADELQMLAWLPVWPTRQEVLAESQPIARRLARDDKESMRLALAAALAPNHTGGK